MALPIRDMEMTSPIPYQASPGAVATVHGLRFTVHALLPPFPPRRRQVPPVLFTLYGSLFTSPIPSQASQGDAATVHV